MDPSIVAFGLTGLVNTCAFATAGYFFLPLKERSFYFYWWAWLLGTVVHGLFWTVLLILWPMVYMGDVDLLDFIDTYISIVSFGGAYGAYEVVFVLIVIGSIWNFDYGFPYSNLIAWAVTMGYLGLAGLSGYIGL